jgi:hypothetical protein
MELPPASSYDVLAFTQAEDDAKYIEQYLAQLLPNAHLPAGVGRPPYIRGIGYPAQIARPTMLSGTNPPSNVLQDLPEAQQPVAWQQGLQPFGWRASEPMQESTGSAPRNLRGAGAFGTAPNTSTQLFKRPAPDGEDSQLAREDSVLMDSLSDPNDGPSQKRATSLQEKNRRAQKRFREKQKARGPWLRSSGACCVPAAARASPPHHICASTWFGCRSQPAPRRRCLADG